MNRTVLSRGSILLVFLMLFNTFSLGWSWAGSAPGQTDLDQEGLTQQSDRAFSVSVLREGSWQVVNTAQADKYFETFEISMPDWILEMESPHIKIEKIGGGLSHVDYVQLNSHGRIDRTFPNEDLTYKVLEKDNDVVEVTETGLEIEFSQVSPTFEGMPKLTLNGRIEEERIGTIPFTYPKSNDPHRMGEGSDFYAYKWNTVLYTNDIDGDISGVENQEALFKIYDIPGSGHPAGYTYAWIMNDEDYLYAVLDFTPDNTFDGDKDYASLYIDTPSGVKAFTVSESQKEWGAPCFTYTGQVGYQHKVYEFKIPVEILDTTNVETLGIAFTAYGTAMPQDGPTELDMAYGSGRNEYMVVYSDEDSMNEQKGIFAQRFDYEGNPIGSEIELSPMSATYPSSPKIAYNEIYDEYVVVWYVNADSTTRIEAVKIDSDGSTVSSPVKIDENQVGLTPDPNEFRSSPDIEYSKDNNKFAVVWHRSGEDGYEFLEGIILAPDMSIYTDLDFGSPSADIGLFELSYNSTNYSYTLVYEIGDYGQEEIFYNEFSKYGVTMSNETRVSPSGDFPLAQPSVVHNLINDDEFVIWTDQTTAPDMIYGAYKVVSEGAITLAESVRSAVHTATLAKGQSKDEILMMWVEDSAGYAVVKGQVLDSDGSPVEEAINIFNTNGGADHVTAAANGYGGYLTGFIYTPIAGDKQIGLTHIGDVNPGEVAFYDTTIYVTEGDTAQLKIERTNGLDGEISVDYTTTNITASDSDYTVTSGTAVFSNGIDTYILDIDTTTDQDTEGSETFLVSLSNVTSGAAIGTDYMATVVISDGTDDLLSGQYDPDTAYDSTSNKYLVVYEELSYYDLTESMILGQFYDSAGPAIGSAFEIVAPSSTLPNRPSVSYNSVEDEYLVAWIESYNYMDTGYYAIIDSSGSVTTQPQAVTDASTQEAYSIDTAYSPISNKYFIVWDYKDIEVYTESIDAVVVDSSGNKSAVTLNASDAMYLPRVIYNGTDDTFDVAFEYADGQKSEVRTSVISSSGSLIEDNLPVDWSSDDQFDPVISHNATLEDDYIIWGETGTEDRLMGQYRSVSGSAIELASSTQNNYNYDHMERATALADMRLFWVEDDYSGDVPMMYLKTQTISDSNGFEDSPVNVDSTENYFTSVSGAYDFELDQYLVAYGYKATSEAAIRVALIVPDDGSNPTDNSIVNMAHSSKSVTEGTTLTLTVNRTGTDLSFTDTVQYSISPGTATTSDYTDKLGTLTFLSQETSKTINIEITDDTEVEDSETFTVTLSSPGGNAKLGTNLTTVVTILDNDSSEPVSAKLYMESDTAEVVEGKTAYITVKRTDNLSGTDTVSYTFTNGTADATDFNNTGGTITFSPDEDSKTIGIDTVSDDVFEADETFTVVLENPSSGAVLGSQNTTEITIKDDDSKSEISFELDKYSVEEGEDAVLTVMRTGNLKVSDTVNYTTSNGTADGTDYTQASGTLIFAPDEYEKTVTIKTTEDLSVETDETLLVTLSAPSGNAELGQVDTAEITIENDDYPSVSFMASTASVSEGDTLTLTLEKSQAYTGTIEVDYSISYGTANAADVSAQSGIVIFGENDLTKTITIQTTEDSTVESNEIFAVEITSDVEAYIGEISVVTVTIVNDDTLTKKKDKKDTTTTPDTNTDTGTAQTQEDTASKTDVENLTSAISESIASNTEGVSTNVADAYLNAIEENLNNIEDEAVLTDALTSYVGTLEAVSQIGSTSDQQAWVESQIVKISDVVSKSLQKIEDDASAVKVATEVVNQLKQIEEKTQTKQTPEVKNKIAQLAQSVLTKVSKVEVKPTVQVVGEVSEVKFDKAALTESIVKKAENFNTLRDSFNTFYGSDNVREFDFEVTLVSDRVADKVQVPIDKDTIDTLKASGVDALSVEVGGTTVTIDRDVYASEEVEAQESFVVDMDFNDQGFEIRDEKINFKAGVITDVKVLVGTEEKKKLEKPVELKFNLGDFEFWEEDAQPTALSIFKLDEETGEWNPVGGIYDPVTNTVKTRRISLSQYTVMQSNKSFADVENSWAKDEINELLGKGIIDETASFDPEETITREEFTTWVARAYGLVDDEADAPFTDLPQDHDHYSELASAYNAGIVSGGGDGSFNPDSAITKEQMSTILANAMTRYDDMKTNEDLKGTLASASDSDLISDWAGDDLAMLIELGVIDNSTGQINPQQQLSKEEAASILKKIYG